MKKHRWKLSFFLAIISCCVLPALPVAYDPVIYPFWINLISPRNVHFSNPRLIAEGLDAYKITWSGDGSRIEVYEIMSTLTTPHTPDLVKVFDAHTGVLVDMYEKDDPPNRELSVCPDKNIAVEFKYIEERKLSLSFIRDDQQAYEFVFSPVQRGEYEDSRGPYGASFSPRCNYLTFMVNGWIGREADGRNELWLLDVHDAILRPIVIGRWPVFKLWDYPVQSVQPDWSPDEDEIVFGDSEFGFEIYNIETKKRRWLAGPGTLGLEPIWSHDNKWIAAEQPRTDQNSNYDSILVISLDGNKKAETGQCLFFNDIEWSLVNNVLAYLCSSSQGNNSLWVWELDGTLRSK